jgi:hypothetical protein
MKFSAISDNIRNLLLAAGSYIIISMFFFWGLISSRGDVAQQDWGLPLTSNAALNIFSYINHAWLVGGFGGPIIGRWGFPYFISINAALSPLGFVGGAEIKILAVCLVAFSGITTYLLARSFGLGFLSSFLSGIFYMTTAVVFDFLMFGWYYYMISYLLLPLMLLITKKYLETYDIRYLLINGIVLSVALVQPAYILVYPLLGAMFILFKSKGHLKVLGRGLIFTVGSYLIWFMLSLRYFLTSGSTSTLVYNSGVLVSIQDQATHLIPINVIRLWGSTWNHQFETYFPKELLLLSFLPILLAMVTVLLRPRNRYILFFLSSYLFVYLAYFVKLHMKFLVFNAPFGSLFEVALIFLVPGCIGLALLIGYSHETISEIIMKRAKSINKRSIKAVTFILIFTIILTASLPWWTGQTSGTPINGPPTKLNLYSVPSEYKEWVDAVKPDSEYFVMYVPLADNIQISNSQYFSLPYEGVNGVIFSQVNDLPFISISNTTTFLKQLINGTSDIGTIWGVYSIKYIVVYTNTLSNYNITDLVNRLSNQNGITQAASFPNVIVFQNNYAKPIVYSNTQYTTTQITYHDPTIYKITVNSSTTYNLTFNQVYSDGWVASVNGTKLSGSQHFKDKNGFNGWNINSTGTMVVNLYYEPQTTYLISTLVSFSVIVVIVLSIVILTIKKKKLRKGNK